MAFADGLDNMIDDRRGTSTLVPFAADLDLVGQSVFPLPDTGRLFQQFQQSQQSAERSGFRLALSVSTYSSTYELGRRDLLFHGSAIKPRLVLFL